MNEFSLNEVKFSRFVLNMENKIITLSVEIDLTSAYLIKGLLEENGIECFVANENVTTANPLYTNAVGGIPVEINEKDREEALAIIARNKLDVLAADNEEELEPDTETSDIICPKCGSNNVRKEKFSIAAIALSTLLIGLPIPFLKRKCHCFNCQNEWK